MSSNKQDKLAVERLVKGAVLLGDFATSASQQPVMSNDSPATTIEAAALYKLLPAYQSIISQIEIINQNDLSI